jgi:exopolyphosphatase / guanosine-5'-triphosphate,3'-diphosphate pyrophosphatase
VSLAASIDIGTNTVRLLAAEVRGGRITREILNLRETTRLGEGIKEGAKLAAKAKERTIETLVRFSKLLLEAGVEEVSAVGTAALRQASDGEQFMEQVRERAGLRLRIISQEEEARLTLLGVRAGFGEKAPEGSNMVVDIGGGSTEFILTENWEENKSVSIPAGAVTLFERFILNDPPTATEMAELEKFCVGLVMPIFKNFSGSGGEKPRLIGTAGTITTLAAIDLAMEQYEPGKVTGHKLGRDRVEVLQMRLAGLSKESRRLIAGIEPGREDIILSGTLLLGVIMDAAKADSITVCDYGLREGNLLDYYDKKGSKD